MAEAKEPISISIIFGSLLQTRASQAVWSALLWQASRQTPQEHSESARVKARERVRACEAGRNLLEALNAHHLTIRKKELCDLIGRLFRREIREVEDLAWRVLVEVVPPGVCAGRVTVAVAVRVVFVELILGTHLCRRTRERHFRVLGPHQL